MSCRFLVKVGENSSVSTSDGTGGAVVVILVDAEDGSFKEASWVTRPVEYLPISEEEALTIAGEVLKRLGLDPDFYTRSRDYCEVLPWSHIQSGVSRDFLRNEDEKAGLALTTADCRNQSCGDCGVCAALGVIPRLVGEQDV